MSVWIWKCGWTQHIATEGSEWMVMISPIKRFLVAVAADAWPHYYGLTGFNSGDGKVIDWRLGPFLGRVSTSKRCLKFAILWPPQSYISNVSLSWFKTLSILVWLFLMLLHLGPWRNHMSNFKFTNNRNLTRDRGARRKLRFSRSYCCLIKLVWK